jgi:methyl-accepting chemotaxis protein
MDMKSVYEKEGIDAARLMVSDGGTTATASVALSAAIQEMLEYNYKIAVNYAEENHNQYHETVWFLSIIIIVAVALIALFSWQILTYLKKVTYFRKHGNHQRYAESHPSIKY